MAVRFAIAGLACAALAACATGGGEYRAGGVGASSVSSGGYSTAAITSQKVGRPYQVSGKWYVPARQDDYDETGIASWYGPNFHGRPTANGEVFDMNQISAAHPTLPIPSIVKVTNLSNGRELVVRVNDRGPFAQGRIIDLSKAAASELGFINQGVTKVRVQYIGPRAHELGNGWSQPASVDNDRPIYIQAASFRDRRMADDWRSRLSRVGRTRLEPVKVAGVNYHRVMVGPYNDGNDAENARQALARFGFGDAKIVRR